MEEEEKPGSPPSAPKKGKGRLIVILIALVLVSAAGAAGAVFAPRMLNKSADASDEHASEAGDSEATEAAEAQGEGEEGGPNQPDSSGHSGPQRAGKSSALTELNALVIDARAGDGSVRHIKVVLVIEHPEKYETDEFKRYVPFAREAAIGYLRTREFEQLADPKNFEVLRKQLAAEIIEAVGAKQAQRVLITDYVVQ